MVARAQLLSIFACVAAASTLQGRENLCEPVQRICYGAPGQGGTAQNLDVSDVEYVASFLRDHGRENRAMFRMPSGFRCEEWTVETPGSGTVMVLAKHVNPRTRSVVSFEDIANTIDGGENASDAAKSSSLLGCGGNGGSFGVQVNQSSSAYDTDEFKTGKAKAQDIIIKLVRQPESD